MSQVLNKKFLLRGFSFLVESLAAKIRRQVCLFICLFSVCPPIYD